MSRHSEHLPTVKQAEVLTILLHGHRHGGAQPRQSWLAFVLAVSTATVCARLQALRERGYLRWGRYDRLPLADLLTDKARAWKGETE